MMLQNLSTRTDDSKEWRINDAPDQLRDWATGTIYRLPPVGAEYLIGSAGDCWLQLQDSSGHISRHHAKLKHVNDHWKISDLQSKNGIHEDGVQRVDIWLSPGVEVGIGDVILVVDSPMLRMLRELLSRLIGWSDACHAAVDVALRAVRVAAVRHESLLLCGDGDLVSVARMLHRQTHGNDRPFIVCDPRRQDTDPNARAAANYSSGIEALSASAGGTLCVWQNRQPHDMEHVLAAIRARTARAQLVVCTHAVKHGALTTMPVVLPSLAERASELNRIIDAYAVDAVAELDAVFTAADRLWVRQNESASLPDIERAVRRLAAIRTARGVHPDAARMLGMSFSALHEWVYARRQLPDLD